MSKPPTQQSTSAPATSGGQDPAANRPKTHRHDEDELHVPKGVSRGTFLFLVGLMIFLLVIWLVPNAMFGIASGPKNPVLVRIVLPSGEKVEWQAAALQTEHRAIVDALGADRFLPLMLGIDASKPEPRELTRLMVIDRIARDAGIEVTDAEVAAQLTRVLGFQRLTPEDFRQSIRARGLSELAVESKIRMLLRVSRFTQLLGYIGGVPDPKKIEEFWHRDNVEFAFEYVTLKAGDLKDAARAEIPADTELEAWFTKLPDGQKAEFKSEERRTGEVAFFRDTETTPATALLEAYPEKVPEGGEPQTPEEWAQQYYNRVQWRRFAKPDEKAPEGGALPSNFFTFDEVKEACLAEAPVFFALQRWIEDLNARHTNGETIDFAAEAEKYGFEFQSYLEPLTRAELASSSGAGDREIANSIFGAPPDGSFYASPVALPQGLAVVRSNSRVEASIPAFGTIRDKVAEKWVEERAGTLGVERLTAARAKLESFEPAAKDDESAPRKKEKKAHYRASSDAFHAAAAELGLEVHFRDYLNKAGPAANPLADDDERRTLFAQANTWGLYDLETDEVAAPGTTPDKGTAYLVRLAGKRDVPVDRMSPTDFERYKTQARQGAVFGEAQQFDIEYLKKYFGLWLYEDSPEGKAEREKASKAKN